MNRRAVGAALCAAAAFVLVLALVMPWWRVIDRDDDTGARATFGLAGGEQCVGASTVTCKDVALDGRPGARDDLFAWAGRATLALALVAAALVRGLPGVLDVRVMVVLPVDDPLVAAPPTPARATVIAVARAVDPSPIRTAATTGARSLIGADAEVTVVVVPAPAWRRASRRLAVAVAALALAAAATAIALTLARRRALATYRGTKPQ